MSAVSPAPVVTGPDHLLNVEQVAARLGLSKHVVYQLVYSGALKAVYPTKGALRLRSSDVDTFIAGLPHEVHAGQKKRQQTDATNGV